jgi:acetyl esterase/lipase
MGVCNDLLTCYKGNAALSTCYRIIEDQSQPTPGGVVMLSPWLDLTRSTSGHSPNQPTDWLTTFDSEECRKGAIEVYMGTAIKSASDPRVSPLFRKPCKYLPKQFLSAGTAEVLFADAEKWAEKVRDSLGEDAIDCHFAKDQVHTFAIGGWLADRGPLEISDSLLLSFVKSQIAAI